MRLSGERRCLLVMSWLNSLMEEVSRDFSRGNFLTLFLLNKPFCLLQFQKHLHVASTTNLVNGCNLVGVF